MPAARSASPVLPLGVAVEVDAIVADPALIRSIPGRPASPTAGCITARNFPRTACSPSPPRWKLGAGIECDLRLTADDQILVFHDADAWRLCAQPAADRRNRRSPSSPGCGSASGRSRRSQSLLAAGRRPRSAAARGQGRRRHLALGRRRCSGALAGYAGPFGVMSFDPRLPRLLKTNLPAVRRGLVVRDQPAAAGSAGWQCGWPIPISSPSIAPRSASPGSRGARRRMPVYSWTIRTAAERAASRGSRRRRSSGKPMADRETELIARLAPGVAAIDAGAWDRAGRRRPVPQPRLPRRAGSNRAASARAPAGRRRRSWSRTRPARCSPPRRPISRATARANMSSTMAGPTRSSAPAGNIIPSCRSRCRSRRCPGQRLLGAAAAATARRGRGGRPTQNGLSSAHVTFIDEAGAARVRAARLADPRRHPISLAQPRLCELRRFPRRADQPQAQGDPQGARGGARRARVRRAARRRDRAGRVGRDVGLLPGHRQPQMGPALSDPRLLRPDRARRWATGCCCSSPVATAGRSPARSTSIGPDTLYGRYWGTRRGGALPPFRA